MRDAEAGIGNSRGEVQRRFYHLFAARRSSKDLTLEQKEEIRKLEVCEGLNEYFAVFEKITGKELHEAAKFIFALIHSVSGGFQTKIKDAAGRNHPIVMYKYGRKDILDHELEHLVDSYVGTINEGEVTKGALLSKVTLVSLASMGISGVAGTVTFFQNVVEAARGENANVDALVFYLAIIAISMGAIVTSSVLYGRLPHEESANRNRK